MAEGSRRCKSLLVVFAALSLPAPLAAAPETAADIAERLSFVETRLDAGRDRAALWQNGWSAAYAAVALGQGALALTENDRDNQVANGVGALRAVTAFTLLQLRPHPGRKGADPVRAMARVSDADRLLAAEALLTGSARRAGERYSPRRHLINVGMNLAFGGMICAFGDCSDAPLSILIGIAGGEAALWSLPKQPLHDQRAYGRRFGPATGPRISWELVPTVQGLGVRGRF